MGTIKTFVTPLLFGDEIEKVENGLNNMLDVLHSLEFQKIERTKFACYFVGSFKMHSSGIHDFIDVKNTCEKIVWCDDENGFGQLGFD